MLDNSMGWTNVSNKLVMTTIGTSDSAVPANAKWILDTSIRGYRFKSSSGNMAITLPTTSGGNITITNHSAGASAQTLTIKPITASYHGVTIKNKIGNIKKGNSFRFRAAVYSTYNSINGGNVTWSVTSGISNATINSSTGLLTGVSTGDVTIAAKYKYSSSTYWTARHNLKITKKAYIIIPGIMGSQIFADGNIRIGLSSFSAGDLLWAPTKQDLLIVGNKIHALECNPDGTPYYPTRANPPTINQYNLGGDFKYGTQDIYRGLYNELYTKYYSSSCDIVLFEYDWREDPYDTSLKLSSFINEKYYADIVFVSHSMGGLVSSYYLSLGQSQRNLVDKHISVGTPYLGTPEMPYKFFTGIILDTAEANFIDSAVKDIIFNIPSIYGLFSFQENWQRYLSYIDENGNTINCNTYSHTMSILEEYLPNWNSNIAESVCSNHSRMFLSNGKHITTLVDSYYIIGTSVETSSTTTIKLGYEYGEVRIESFSFSNEPFGDGTVHYYSASIGDTIEEDKIYYASGETHIEMIKGGSGDTPNFSTIIDIIDNN
mgnify:FL=1